ncbi:polyprenyl synthetase family protein [Robbsia sp. Bb-Pol-6]|uniref:Polyprenyl synthetase family protein n=1 Tax=Robbsia betulipollinis TaxID=2981849 RepID=A0ABT3ZP01_9BURK|nr:polyprenyl synthetase family protein [Robbsia betulipollinis]MCY0387693.1 polyprenyl synthetase family protein [Robbsia betulipollinis]
MDFSDWMKGVQARTEAALDHYLPAAGQAPARLHEAMRYAALGGGKRVRPLLCHAAGEALGAAPGMLDAAAAAVEMIHVYSLVHDDLPSMDNDALRRGKPTVHVRYDDATGLLVGDALQSQAFVTLCAPVLPVPLRAALVGELAVASGSVGMAGGQAIDLASVGLKLDRAALETMHRLKTGALLRAAVRMGALTGAMGQATEVAPAGTPVAGTPVAGTPVAGTPVAGTPVADAQRAALDAYADAIGLAFQVVDDILDVTADSATLGKTAGKDALADKPTYVSILGLDASRALAKSLRHDAHRALESFGARALRLAQLADLIVERAY